MNKQTKFASIGFCAAALLVVTIVYTWQIRLSVAIQASNGRSSGSSHTAAEYQPAIEEARRIIRPLLDRYPGISVAVGVNDSLAWAEAFGYSDAKARIAASPVTKFRAYSLAKPLTATAVLRLSREGRIDLDAPISRYLQQLPAPLFARMKTSADKETDYGFGWGWNVDSAGERYVGHSGGAIGGRSALLLYPGAKVVVAILANIEDERFGEVTSRIGRLFIGNKSQH